MQPKPRQVSSKEIEERKAKGAGVMEHPKQVHGSMNVPGLIEAIETLSQAQLDASKHQSHMMIKAIDALTRSINSKELRGTDVSELVAAVAGLKQEAVAVHEPVDYTMTFARDQRQLIDGEQGVRFTAVPRIIN